MSRLDALVLGGGHNGLVAATLLARAGWSVRVLERGPDLGGAATSAAVFPGLDARLSRYSYLVSLFPQALRDALGLRTELRRRRVSWYASEGGRGVLVGEGAPAPDPGWEHWQGRMQELAARLAPTLTRPLLARQQARARVGAERTWEDVFEAPLSVALEREFTSDLVRGVVLTDALIGTFASAGDPSLVQNRCFLYHVIGDGTGEWRVPVGGMGALMTELVAAARGAGAELRVNAEAGKVDTDGHEAQVTCTDGSHHRARHLLCAAAPTVLAELLGNEAAHEVSERPEGSQLKLNMLLKRLPRPGDATITAADAFAGTFHAGEGYADLQRAHEEAASGRIPTRPPCEVYCHSLTDPSILSPALRAAGAHTLTLFALHMPARLFREAHDTVKSEAVRACLASLDRELAEPVEDCLWRDREGAPCLEAITPVELEAELGMPGGHIFHRDLQWPYAEVPEEVERWGAETPIANVWLCGAGARRGGGVSGIAGHNAAQAVLQAG